MASKNIQTITNMRIASPDSSCNGRRPQHRAVSPCRASPTHREDYAGAPVLGLEGRA
jgi:hypothetical protein